jgi:hypothetical protein
MPEKYRSAYALDLGYQEGRRVIFVALIGLKTN